MKAPMDAIVERFPASYHRVIDVLFAGDVSSPCYSIEDTPSGMTVMRAEDGSPTGVEIPDFCKRFPELPDIIEVDSTEPFSFSVDGLTTYPMKL